MINVSLTLPKAALAVTGGNHHAHLDADVVGPAAVLTCQPTVAVQRAKETNHGAGSHPH